MAKSTAGKNTAMQSAVAQRINFAAIGDTDALAQLSRHPEQLTAHAVTANTLFADANVLIDQVKSGQTDSLDDLQRALDLLLQLEGEENNASVLSARAAIKASFTATPQNVSPKSR